MGREQTNDEDSELSELTEEASPDRDVGNGDTTYLITRPAFAQGIDLCMAVRPAHTGQL